MIISHEIMKKQKISGKPVRKDIIVFPYTESLINTLEANGIIQHMKNVAQLGNIFVPKQFNNTRYDYLIFQMYLQQFAHKHINSDLEYSCAGDINGSLFPSVVPMVSFNKPPSIADILQLLSVSYNLGHYYNTFSASRGVLKYLELHEVNINWFINLFEIQRHKELAHSIISKHDYHHFHLLNSLLFLFDCDRTVPGVAWAINVLTEYLDPSVKDVEKYRKIIYIFNFYKRIRDLSYVIYDLNIAPLPMIINILNESEQKKIMFEMLANYNDDSTVISMIRSIQKLLSDSVYNTPENVIYQSNVATKISKQVTRDSDILCTNRTSYIHNYVLSQDSIFNRHYTRSSLPKTEQFLKLTFSCSELDCVEGIAAILSKINFVRAGFYTRLATNEKTFIVTISPKCLSKIKCTFKVMKKIITIMQAAKIARNDKRYLLAVKFFLYYLCGEVPLRINPTIDNCCVWVQRGKKAKISLIDSIIKTSTCIDEDKRHEAEWLKRVIAMDGKNDTVIAIPSSIVLYNKMKTEKMEAELDGLIIYPFRNKGQVVFLEAKNTAEEPSSAKRCLEEKLHKMGISFDPKKIETYEHDCLYKFDLQ